MQNQAEATHPPGRDLSSGPRLTCFPVQGRVNLPRMISSLTESLSRRQFLARSVLAAVGTAACGPALLPARADDKLSSPIVVFTKVYQALSLNFEDSAAITAEAQLEGVDIPVRPKGEVEPERVSEDLPRYAEALKKRGLAMPLLTTAITAVSSPHAETTLTTAKKLGAQYYRVGFLDRDTDVPKQIREVRAALKDLAALNKQIGLTALLQNHSPSGHAYLGGDLAELRELVVGFNSAEIGVAFDIGHALIVHQDQWRKHFDEIKSHLKIAYVKDASKNGRWVPFGQGMPFQAVFDLYLHAGARALFAGTHGRSMWKLDLTQLASVGEHSKVATIALSTPSPNPSRGPVSFTLDLPVGARARLSVFDALGRRVRSIHDGSLAAGRHAFTWDGKDASSRPVRPGVYFMRAETPGEKRSKRIVRVQ